MLIALESSAGSVTGISARLAFRGRMSWVSCSGERIGGGSVTGDNDKIPNDPIDGDLVVSAERLEVRSVLSLVLRFEVTLCLSNLYSGGGSL